MKLTDDYIANIHRAALEGVPLPARDVQKLMEERKELAAIAEEARRLRTRWRIETQPEKWAMGDLFELVLNYFAESAVRK